MFELGQSVFYIRQDKNNLGQAIDGEAVVMAICLDAEKRKVVQLKAGEDVFNVDYYAVNPSEAFKDDYKALILQIKGLTDTANKAVAGIVAEANKEISDAANAVLGHPMDLSYPEKNKEMAEAA